MSNSKGSVRVPSLEDIAALRELEESLHQTYLTDQQNGSKSVEWRLARNRRKYAEGQRNRHLDISQQ